MTIFKTYIQCGIKLLIVIAWVYSDDLKLLQGQVHTFIEIYNTAVDRKRRHDPKAPIEDFIDTNDPHIKWSHRVKQSLKNMELSNYEESHFRTALYRPFCKQYLYFDHFWNERRYQQHYIFPTPENEAENRQIIVSDHGFRSGFNTLMTNLIPDLHTLAASDSFQCFPFYTYDEDGTNRRENITDWVLAQFRITLQRRVYQQVGHLPLYLRYLTSSRLSREIPSEP